MWVKTWKREFPGGPVVGTHHFHCHGSGSIPGKGTRILQAMRHSQKNKQANKQTKKLGEEKKITDLTRLGEKTKMI